MPEPSDPTPIRAAELSTRLHDELRSLAAARLRGANAAETVQATALVHEAWLKLRGDGTFADQGAFFGAAARAMRDVLVDRVRARLAEKRGGGAGNAPLESGLAELRPAIAVDDVLSLDSALTELQRDHPDEHEVTLRRFFAGRTNHEIAGDLGVAERTVERRWRFARAWLARRLGTAFDARSGG